MKTWTPEDLRRAGIVWLLDLTWAGQVWRFASEPVVVPTDAGEALVYLEGPFPDAYSDGADLFSSTTTPTSIGFEGLVFDHDVAELVARGHWLELGTAEVSQWMEGRTWEQRRVVLRGRVRDPRHGVDGDPVSFSVSPDELDEGELVPPAAAVVSAATWPSAAESALGASYPWVFGRPGLGLSTDLASTAGAPALLVHVASRYLLVAGHRVAASSVDVIDVTNGVRKPFNVTHRADGLGRQVATVTLDAAAGAGNITAADGVEYAVDWSETGGGLEADGALVTSAGDVAIWLLSAAGVEYDRGAWAALRSRLAPYRLDFYLDDPESPLRLLREAVLPLVPVSMSRGPYGIEPTWWRVDATAADAAIALEHERNMEVLDLVDYVDPPLANEFRMTYAPRWTGEPYRTLTYTGDAAVGAGDATVQPFGPCVASRSVWGALTAEPLDTRLVQRPEVAGRVLAWRAQAHAFPWRVVQCRALDPELALARKGDVATVTHAGLHWSDQVGLVREIEWDGDSVILHVVVLFLAARDRIPTS